ncbi:hypothetical protein [Sabulibacter ruber]|uniref:hypothetical protein n=1 Tax=Sabulibacter ruber TaxID=2811901 RepID=UPI001A96223F|nr:hypothetical protein [Sabulibacter ruber]
MHYSVPSNFDIEKHLEQYPLEEWWPQSAIKDFCPDKLHYVLSLPIEIPSNNKDLKHRNGFVPINSTALKNAIGNEYKHYLDYLVNTGVFDGGNNQYRNGIHSRMYRYTKEYRQGFRTVEVKKTFSFTYKKEITKLEEERLRELDSKIGKHLIKQFNKDLLKMDLEGAESYMRSTFLKGVREVGFLNLKNRVIEVNNLNRQDPTAKEKLTPREKKLLKFYTNLHAAMKIADGNFYHGFDTVSGRFHSSLTNLKKELRNFLTYGGESLYEVDLKNSQMWFSLLLLDREFYGKKRVRGAKFSISPSSMFIDKGIPNVIDANIPSTKAKITFKRLSIHNVLSNEIFQCLPNVFSNVMLQDILKDIDNEDVVHYRNVVLEGKLYDYLLDRYEEKTGRKDMDRGKMKKVMFTILFSENEKETKGRETMKAMKIREQREAAKDLFRSCFPTVMRLFEYIKQENHRLLACLLQAIEAHVLLNKVCGRIKRERPAMPLFTVHDSILTTEMNKDYLVRVVREECLRLTGYTPRAEPNLLHPGKLEMPFKTAA